MRLTCLPLASLRGPRPPDYPKIYPQPLRHLLELFELHMPARHPQTPILENAHGKPSYNHAETPIFWFGKLVSRFMKGHVFTCMGRGMRARALSSALSFLILAGLLASTPNLGAMARPDVGVEIDVSALVYRVVDGDTFDAFPVGRVRLADINAPELGTPEGAAAREALIRLILNKRVYLDVDDVEVMDRYYRLVCVVYLRYNSTHLLNVNKWLLENRYAEVMDYPNEFSPGTWALHVQYPQTDLPDSYDALLQNYLRLESDHSSLRDEFQKLESEYEKLNMKYMNIIREFEKLNSTYNDLIEKQSNLISSYEKLKGDYDALQSSYKNFKSDFSSLKNVYEAVKAENEKLMAKVNMYSLLMYAFIITTSIFGAATIYLIRKRRK
jgi:endonuclease YncB( thermonuclease family)